VGQVNLLDTASLKKMHRAYYASVSYIDHKLGEVLKALDRYGLRDNTIVVFLSDHGDMLGHRGMVQKRTFYEWSSHIPLMISFPKNFAMGKSGISCDDPVSITDVAPTIMELAGIKDYLPMDGRSLLPQLKGQTDTGRYVFCENYSEGVRTVCLMIRKGDYKFTYIHDDGSGKSITQLFNLINDPEEWTNLSGLKKYKQVEVECKDLIFKHFNPDEIEKEAQLSFERRKIIHDSRKKSNAPSWNYQPKLDIDNLYWR
jgi:choline-sulfatase